MGAGASKEIDSHSNNEHDDDNCHCFLFNPPTRKKSDTLGTPLPQQFNRKRGNIPEPLPPPTREVRGRESSRYGGLEVSIGGGSNGIYTNGSVNNSLPAAIVHEGEVRQTEIVKNQ